MPSWEDIINQVVIPGEPSRLREAVGIWDTVFAQIRAAKDQLEQGLRGLDGWQGEAADTYRTNVGAVGTTLADLDTDFSGVQHEVSAAADQLDTAINSIEIPAEMAAFVQQAKQGFLDHRQLAGLGPDAIYNWMAGLYKSNAAAAGYSLVPDFLKDLELQARDALSSLKERGRSTPVPGGGCDRIGLFPGSVRAYAAEGSGSRRDRQVAP